jgi:hypothetical protein
MAAFVKRFTGLWITLFCFFCMGCEQTPIGGGPVDTGGGDNGNNNAAGDVVSFESGGVSLNARTIDDGGAQSTSISQGGQTVVQMRTTLNDLTVSFPTQGENVQSVIEFTTPLEGQPSEFALNRLATLIAAETFYVPDESRQDSPGCDWFPDTRCTLRCCADHDRCYAENSCSFTSWLPLVGSDACDNCNSLAASCILLGCSVAGIETNPESDVCYDASCRMSYDCPEFNCDCPSPCAAPTSCGNGTCEVGEDADNCASDCASGLGVNICCFTTDNCPTETPTSCPGGCCCCGLGEVCGPGNLCTTGIEAKDRNGDASPIESNGPELKRRMTEAQRE